MVFHGGGGTARGTERLTGLSDLAEREHFIVAYPEGIERSWNDGRETTVSRAHRDQVDDVHFVATMIDTITKEHRIDPKRIYATGVSLGRLAGGGVGGGKRGKILSARDTVKKGIARDGCADTPRTGTLPDSE